jgi:hypothetical protein
MPDSSDPKPELVPVNESSLESADRVEIMGALFESFVTQQGSLGLSLLGELPDERGGLLSPDIESAKLVIDQLEMFEFKTRGNLLPEEAAFLRKTLTILGEALIRKLESPSGS